MRSNEIQALRCKSKYVRSLYKISRFIKLAMRENDGSACNSNLNKDFENPL